MKLYVIFTLIFVVVSVNAAGTFPFFCANNFKLINFVSYFKMFLFCFYVSIWFLTNLCVPSNLCASYIVGYNGPTNQAGLDLIKTFEGWSPIFYSDPTVSKLFCFFSFSLIVRSFLTVFVQKLLFDARTLKIFVISKVTFLVLRLCNLISL